MPTCLLVRHGRTSANTQGILAGWSEGVSLDDVGRQQVARLAERLSHLPVRAIVTSPLDRCRETAHGLAAALPGVEPVLEESLGECHYGAWTGLPLRDLVNEPLWRVVQDQPSAARFPDGGQFRAESLAEMQLRAVRAVRHHDALVAAEHGSHSLWIAVSHGDVIKAVLSDAAGAHFDHFQRVVVDPASLSVVTYTDRRPFLIRVNDSGADLASLVPRPPESDVGPASPSQESGAAVPDGDAPVGGGAGPR